MMVDPTDGKKHVVVVLNGICQRKNFFYKQYFPMLSQVCKVQVLETLTEDDAIGIASKATNQNVDVILAAGGDGTLNQVVQGVLTGRENQNQLPVIGLIPLGSGNDFARTVGLLNKPEQIKNLLSRFIPRQVDVGKIKYTTSGHATESPVQAERYFINVADVGMGPEVVSRVAKGGRVFGHGFAYFKSILSTFISYRLVEVTATTSDWTWEGKLRTLGVANGKFYGHGLCIAPAAKPDDQIFSVFICGNVSVFDFIRHTGALKKGKYIRLPEIHYKETSSISLTSKETCMIEGDGEILGVLPATISLVERRIDFLY
jgi:diacylglycerol kinase (ATP)